MKNAEDYREQSDARILDLDDHRAIRLRAREIVNIVLAMADRATERDVPPDEQAECMKRIAVVYGKVLGFTVKQVARMTLIEGLEAVSARKRTTEADVCERIAEFEQYGQAFKTQKIQENVIRATLEREQPGGQRDAQELSHYFERSFPSDRVPLQTMTVRPLNNRSSGFFRLRSIVQSTLAKASTP